MADLLVLALVITIEPLPVVGFILVLDSADGRRNGAAFIAAWVVTLVAIVVAVLALTGGTPPSHASAPALATAVVTVLVGVVLLVVAWKVHQRPPDQDRPEPKWRQRIEGMSMVGAAALGFALQPWGLVAAAATVVVEADINTAATVVVLVVFCLLATSSLLAMEIYAVVRPRAAQARLGRLRDWVDDHRNQGIVVLSAGVGIFLVGKGIYLIAVQKA